MFKTSDGHLLETDSLETAYPVSRGKMNKIKLPVHREATLVHTYNLN